MALSVGSRQMEEELGCLWTRHRHHWKWGLSSKTLTGKTGSSLVTNKMLKVHCKLLKQ